MRKTIRLDADGPRGPLARPPGNDDDEPTDDPPRPPFEPFSIPDVALQVRSPIEPHCFAPEVREQLRVAVAETLRAQYPRAEVLTHCWNEAEPTRAALTIGVWTRGLDQPGLAQARERGLPRVALLTGGSLFGYFLKESFIRVQADAGFRCGPRRFDADGHPDPDGPVHLSTLAFELREPDQVITRIHGLDERPWPDVSFELVLTDTLVIRGAELVADSTQQIDIDDSDAFWAAALGVLLLGATFVVHALLPVTAFVLYQDADAAGSGGDLAQIGGVGARIIDPAVVPRSLAGPDGRRLALLYHRVRVERGGITFEATPIGV